MLVTLVLFPDNLVLDIMILSRIVWLSCRRGASLSTASCSSSSLHFSTGASDTQERTIAVRRRKPRLKFSDSFGGLSQDLVMRHEQRREEHKETQEEQDGEEEYLAKVGDSMRTSRSEFNRRIVRCLKDGDLQGALRLDQLLTLLHISYLLNLKSGFWTSR